MATISKIHWPRSPKKVLTIAPEMNYESLDLLYNETKQDIFGDHMGFIVSCSKHFSEPIEHRGCIQKLEVSATPSFADAKIQITHEVLPNQGACSQILPIRPYLKVAGFDNGAIVPIKNFGYKRTFHCDVRSRLHHHNSPINCIASNTAGTNLASGSTSGDIVLYNVESEDIMFLSRTKVASSCITGLSFFTPTIDTCCRPSDDEVTKDDNLLAFSTQEGSIGLIDKRCGLASEVEFQIISDKKLQRNFTSLCVINKVPNVYLFVGTSTGEVLSFDLRNMNDIHFSLKREEDKCIQRMKEIILEDKRSEKRRFLAYTNSSDSIQILDVDSKKFNYGWICERSPGQIQRDLIQVNDRIVTCGDNTSIGSWQWKNSIDLSV